MEEDEETVVFMLSNWRIQLFRPAPQRPELPLQLRITRERASRQDLFELGFVLRVERKLAVFSQKVSHVRLDVAVHFCQPPVTQRRPKPVFVFRATPTSIRISHGAQS